MSVLQKGCRSHLLYRWFAPSLQSINATRQIKNLTFNRSFYNSTSQSLTKTKTSSQNNLRHLRSLQSYRTSTKQPIQGLSSPPPPIRISKIIATHGLNMQMSRRSAEALIQSGQVTIAGDVVTDPGYKINLTDAKTGGGTIKVSGRRLLLPKSHQSSESPSSTPSTNTPTTTNTKTRVWLVNKLRGELVSEHDPEGRPSLIDRMVRSGVGKPSKRTRNKSSVHLKPIGRLDMMTEGLVLLTNDGSYAREMELPQNALHRTYRVRVHGVLTPGKLRAVRRGVRIDGMLYKGMKVNLELNKGDRVKGGNTNSWLRVSCVEGKNRQVRKVLDYVGLKVTRLIRTSFGDYDLNTIPPGLAIEVPFKPLEGQKCKGSFEKKYKRKKRDEDWKNGVDTGSAVHGVEWVRF